MQLTPWDLRSRMTWKSCRVSCSERLLVGSSNMMIFASIDSALEISTSCCAPMGSSFSTAAGRDFQSHFFENLLCFAVKPLFIEQPRTSSSRLPAKEYVPGHRQVVAEIELLMYQGDSKRRRLFHRVDGHRLAVQPDFTVIGEIDTGKDLHQRALAGPVLADDGQDLPAPELMLTSSRARTPGKVLEIRLTSRMRTPLSAAPPGVPSLAGEVPFSCLVPSTSCTVGLPGIRGSRSVTRRCSWKRRAGRIALLPVKTDVRADQMSESGPASSRKSPSGTRLRWTLAACTSPTPRRCSSA